MNYWIRFINWCQRPNKIKIRTFYPGPRNAVILATFVIILATSIRYLPFGIRLAPTPPGNVQPTQTPLTIAMSSESQWKECTIEATLKDEKGNPLQNMDIGFYVCGSELIGTAKTDSNGVASLKYAPLGTGIYGIKAKFSGTISYTQSSSEYVCIEVIDYNPYIITAAIIGVVGYFVFRSARARKKLGSWLALRPSNIS